MPETAIITGQPGPSPANTRPGKADTGDALLQALARVNEAALRLYRANAQRQVASATQGESSAVRTRPESIRAIGSAGADTQVTYLSPAIGGEDAWAVATPLPVALVTASELRASKQACTPSFPAANSLDWSQVHTVLTDIATRLGWDVTWRVMPDGREVVGAVPATDFDRVSSSFFEFLEEVAGRLDVGTMRPLHFNVEMSETTIAGDR